VEPARPNERCSDGLVEAGEPTRLLILYGLLDDVLLVSNALAGRPRW
jgi:hypothetical protein